MFLGESILNNTIWIESAIKCTNTVSNYLNSEEEQLKAKIASLVNKVIFYPLGFKRFIVRQLLISVMQTSIV